MHDALVQIKKQRPLEETEGAVLLLKCLKVHSYRNDTTTTNEAVVFSPVTSTACAAGEGSGGETGERGDAAQGNHLKQGVGRGG